MDLSEEALLNKLRETKDPALFKYLMRRYQNRIYSVAYRILGSVEEAEEVVQETYIKVYQHFAKFNKASSFAPWVLRITHNRCMDVLRTKEKRKFLWCFSFDPQFSSETFDSCENDPRIRSQMTDHRSGPQESMDLKEQEEIISEKLHLLPYQQRIVVVLHDIEGFSYQEISKIIGASLGTVRSRLHYGRLKLRELLTPYFSITEDRETKAGNYVY